MKKYLFLLIGILGPLFSANGQSPARHTIRGRVTNKDGRPLPGTTLILHRSGASTVSNKDGLFTVMLSVSPDTLSVSRIGYNAKILPVKEGDTLPLAIHLDATSENLHEVVVSTGYRDIPRERATGSFEQIDNKLLDRKVSSGILSRFKYMATGVLFNDRYSTFTVRGLSTINSDKAPLIILDNFPYEGDINNINPNDVESITILKDAAAASIWGDRAGNGVVVITTKKARFNERLNISYNANVTVTEKPDLFQYPQMNTSDFIDVEEFLFDKGFYNADINNTRNYPVLSPVVALLAKARSGEISHADVNAQINAFRNLDYRHDLEKYFYRNAVNQQYSLSMNGGSNNISYLFAAGYDKNMDNLIGQGNERLTLRSRGTMEPLKHLKITAGIQYVHAKVSINDVGGYGGITTGSGKTALYPYARLADSRGNALAIPKDYRASFTDTAGGGLLLDWKYRPLDEMSLTDNAIKTRDILLDLGIRYDFTDYLNLELKYRFENETVEHRHYHDPKTYYARNQINQYAQINGSYVDHIIPIGGILDLSDNELLVHNARAQLNFDKEWRKKSNLSAIAGAEIRTSSSNSHGNRTYGYDQDLLTHSNVDFVNRYPIYDGLSYSRIIPNNVSFGNSLNRSLSFYANASYNYADRYTLSVSARKDASNIYGIRTNQKWVPLWSAGFAWNISNEKFYHIKNLPCLKIRGTYGYSGNANNSLSAYTTIQRFGPDPYTNKNYAWIINPPNPSLRWEKVGMTNIALDFAGKQNRISGSVEYYRKQSTDLIGPTLWDPTAGVNNVTLNIANLSGHGWDVRLNTKNVQSGDFRWGTNFLFSYNQNKVKKYYGYSYSARSIVGGRSYVPLVGKPLYGIFSYRWAGLDPTNGDPRGYIDGKISNDYSIIVSKTPVSNLVYNGSSVPPYFGSLLNSFSWKELRFSLNITYKAGYFLRRTTINYGYLFSGWIGHKDFARRWKRSGDERSTTVPSMIYPADGNRGFFYANSEATVEKGDYVRLQDIRIDYTLDNILHRKLSHAHLQCYLYISNLGILWRANDAGLDPDYGDVNPPLAISIGLKGNF